jgi:hypothetical protein
MQHTTQVELIKRVFDMYDQKSTSMGNSIYRNPISDYTCMDQARLEQQRLFREPPCDVPVVTHAESG